MARQQLTRQQRQRIRRQQQQVEGREARVLAFYGRSADVVLTEDEVRLQRCPIRANTPSLVAGDQVRLDEDGVIIARDSRLTELLRPDSYGKLKAVAANVDQVAVVIAPEPLAFANLIDRYLVAIAASNMQALLIANKSDLVDSREPEFVALLAQYEQLGVPVLRCSSHTGSGLTEVRQALQHNTNVLVGQSGVGKSSLINSLLEASVAAVGDLSVSAEHNASASKGTHTTSTAQLYALADGAWLIDSPGVREFQLWHIGPDQVINGFPELAELAEQCRFRNCSHSKEPGCALREACRQSERLATRWDSCQRIIKACSH